MSFLRHGQIYRSDGFANRGQRIPLAPAIVSMSLRPATPWRVGLHQSPPPLRRLVSMLQEVLVGVNHHLMGGGEFSTGLDSSGVCGPRTPNRGHVYACPTGKALHRGEAGRSTQGWWDASATSFTVCAASTGVQPSVSSSRALSALLSSKRTFALSLLSLSACSHPELLVSPLLDVTA